MAFTALFSKSLCCFVFLSVFDKLSKEGQKVNGQKVFFQCLEGVVFLVVEMLAEQVRALVMWDALVRRRLGEFVVVLCLRWWSCACHNGVFGSLTLARFDFFR
jgi:hypothetical protein